jgi:hypothetical protein
VMAWSHLLCCKQLEPSLAAWQGTSRWERSKSTSDDASSFALLQTARAITGCL